MDKTSQEYGPRFTQPLRQIMAMLAVLVLVSVGIWLARTLIYGVFVVNLWLNFFIAGVFLLGVFTCFWQLVQLAFSVIWIKGFVGRRSGFDVTSAPQLLAPLAALLAQRGAKMQISTISQRSILDSVATRLDEAREVTRYLGNLLIFLGLLGTFYGLATTVPAMVETIRSLTPKPGESGMAVFGKLMGGLEAQLGGMGTAFSSSLLGLAGSLVVGLLDLFAGHGQNRFFRELEEWSSTITRIGLSPSDTGGEEMVAGYDGLGVIGPQLAALVEVMAKAEVARSAADARVVALIGAMERLVARADGEASQAAAHHAVQERMAAGHGLALERIAEGQERLAAGHGKALDRIAEGQERLAAGHGKALDRIAEGQAKIAASQAKALDRIAEGQDRTASGQQAAAKALAALAAPDGGGAHVDAESRMRLRSIDVQLLRILEEISAGRQESISDLRGDLAVLTAAIRQLGRGAGGH